MAKKQKPEHRPYETVENLKALLDDCEKKFSRLNREIEGLKRELSDARGDANYLRGCDERLEKDIIFVYRVANRTEELTVGYPAAAGYVAEVTGRARQDGCIDDVEVFKIIKRNCLHSRLQWSHFEKKLDDLTSRGEIVRCEENLSDEP